jgi:hypothetical protein
MNISSTDSTQSVGADTVPIKSVTKKKTRLGADTVPIKSVTKKCTDVVHQKKNVQNYYPIHNLKFCC